MEADESPQDVKKLSPTNECFYLSKIFNAHSNDVKAVVGTSTGSILSSSRDGSIKLWTERAGVCQETFEIKQKKGYAVNAIAFYQSIDSEWLIFAGIKDGSIEVFNSSSSTPLTVLRNHSQNVCVLYVNVERKILISGSWDARAIVWSIEKILQGSIEIGRELVHHKNSVWAAITLPTKDLRFLTGSADRTIKLHNEFFDNIRTFTGHTDVVRALCAISENEFISSANDGTLRLWNVETGDCLQKCETIANEFVYSLTKLDHKNGKEFIIAGMERGFIEIWVLENKTLISLQNIRIPVSSIWSLTTIRNSDVVLASSSGSIYIYTTDESKKANENILQSFDASFCDLLSREIAAQQVNKNEEVIIKVALDDGAPSLELKYIKGEDPANAAEKFIKENNLPFSYFNEITEYIKTNIPEARLADAAKYKRQETQRANIGNEKFDYAFEVKLTENGEPFYLGYNIGEDPDYAAQRFVEKHNLPVKFLPQLSNYLCSQVPELINLKSNENQFVRNGSDALSGSNNSTYHDPFTGGGRYMPGGSTQANVSNLGDPLTSTGRYIPSSSTSPNKSGKVDKKRPRGEHIPICQFFTFGLENASAKVIPKLQEMNSLQPNELVLQNEQIEAMNEIMSMNVFEIDKRHISALEISLKWSLDTIVPALDVFRVAILNKQLNEIFCSFSPSVIDGKSRGNDTLQRLSFLLISDPPDAIRILVCRAFANASVFEPGRQMLMSDISTICKIVLNQLGNPKFNVQIAATSTIANCARLLLMETEKGKVTELGPREDALRAIINATESKSNFSDFSPIALFRLVQAIATLMWGDSTVIYLAKSRDVKTIITRMKDSITDESGKAICRDIVEMIYAIN